jgi:uncharacterized membrane protein
MATVHESIEIEAPVRVAYDQWTQFETFPTFMEGVKEVSQVDNTHLHWVAEVGGKREEWDAEITEQVPDQRIAWRSVSGKGKAGTVTFESLDNARTRVTVGIDHDTEGVIETVGSALGVDDRRVKADLERFREMIEARGAESGGWRGEVHQGTVTDASELPGGDLLSGGDVPR